MKKFGIKGQLRSKHFFIIIHHFSLAKAAVNAPRLCKLCKDCPIGTGHGVMVFTQRLSFFSNCQRRNKDHCTLVNWLLKWLLKKQGGSLILSRANLMSLISAGSFGYLSQGLPGFSLDSTFKKRDLCKVYTS
jgi:hypothetical protein